MSKPILKIHDISTGEAFEREMNESEFEQFQLDKKARLLEQQQQASQQAEQDEQEAARQSALEKLAALGLTPEEISAITGS